MNKPEESYLCARCLTALDWHDETGWVHSLANVELRGVGDHQVEPVPAANMPEHRYVCDFCFAPDPEWSYPADDFPLPMSTVAGSSGAWAACDACHTAIENRDRQKLVYRATHSQHGAFVTMPASVKPTMTRELHNLFRRFFDARTGEGVRI